MAIIAGLLAGWFVFSLYYHSQNPPTNEQRYRAQRSRRRTARFIAGTAAVTSVKLIKDKK